MRRSGSFDPVLSRRIRASDALVRELEALGAHAGTRLMHSEVAWSSITFDGTRHRIDYAFDGVEAVAHGEALIMALPDHEFTIPGQLVAEASVADVMHRCWPPRLELGLELLLLNEAK